MNKFKTVAAVAAVALVVAAAFTAKCINEGAEMMDEMTAVAETTAATAMSAMTDTPMSTTPAASEGLFLLATTGSGDVLAKAQGGDSYHKSGGNPVTFTYSVTTPWMDTAKTLLVGNEFLAPHFYQAKNGDVFVMVAPHLFTGGMVFKGKGPKDSFIVVSGGVPMRYDYSDDVAVMAPEVMMDDAPMQGEDMK